MKNQIKAIASAIMLLFVACSAFSQQCNLLIKDGSKLTLSFLSYTNPSLYDPKFPKLKEEKKDAQIAEYNASVASGKIAPASNSPMTFTLKKTGSSPAGDEFTITVNIAGKDYSSYLLCSPDTLYVYRNKGAVELPDGKGGSAGFTLQGPQKLPTKIKVGDKLPIYEDISFLYPVNHEGMTQMIKSQVYGDAGQIFSTYDVKVRETVSFSSEIVHSMYAEVTGEDEIAISGTKYKAFIIESETWSKAKMDATYETNNDDLNKLLKENLAKGESKFNKMMLRKGYNNEKGYMVSYLKEWYAPGIGIVKSESYDLLGGIAGGMLTTAIE